ncbi:MULTISPECIES: TIGR01777 family oxidoreductase [Gammaproteobacteria]|uniref:TIGR01777 family oxidoreductase n=1 Tax=Gammaproteobacteria TaxID=1236 RepID=UPI000DD0B905|nr:MULTISPECIES: TIGR01777 family oxidoreductase [Gammaproteobacteria]RTE87575.1 TIGR01777 family protein [Aliidiomarina sp. B3213]TCZ92641.1 TIGR01777 family protein [Lysobacter sp. N42]
MKILITGGTGLIGSAFIERYDHDYTILTRRPESAARQLSDKHTYINRLSELKNLNDFDAVINLAGEPIAEKRWTKKHKARIEKSRWQTTDELVALFEASSKPAATFISGSAVGYYGRQGDEKVTERDYIAHDEFSHELCKTWEDKAKQAETKTRLCLLRTGIVLSPSGGALNRMVTPFKLGLGGPIGHGQQMMSWVHIEDMIEMIQFLLENENCQGVFNATAPQPVSNEKFSKCLAQTLNRPCLFRVPAFTMRLAFGEMADLLLTGQAVLPQKLQEQGFTFKYEHIEPCLKAIFPSR